MRVITRLFGVCCWLGGIAVWALPTAAWAAAHALVVTNNHSLSPDRPDLHYADDDGVKYAQLFSEVLPNAKVTLLTQLDAESRMLFPEWVGRAQSPTFANVFIEAARVAEAARREHVLGELTTVYLVFAGHGDLDHGQGYLELADRRLTSQALDRELLPLFAGLPVHLVLDSCNSYFMLNPRGPSKRRWAVSTRPESVLDHHKNVGALISTSAEAVTYEWSELQSGIFSYELRSGLRGAADLDGNGQVSYVELAAFVETANRNVPNDLYRPKVYARAPEEGRGDVFVSYDFQHGRRLKLSGATAQRLTLRDAHGVRLLDLHRGAAGILTLWLPTSGTLELFERQRDPQGRPVMVVYSMPATEQPGEWALDGLLSVPPALAQRGESPVFESLFATPFEAAAIASYQARHRDAAQVDDFGIGRRDVVRLRQHLQVATAMERDERVRTGVMGAALAAVAGYELLDLTREKSFSASSANDQILAGLSVFVGATGVVMAVTTQVPVAELYDDYESMDDSQERQRAVNVLATERRFAALAEQQGRWRQATAVGLIVGGAAMVAVQTVSGPVEDAFARNYLRGMLGVGIAGLGIYSLVSLRQPTERVFELYAGEAVNTDSSAAGSVAAINTKQDSAFTWRPLWGLTTGGVTVGVGGRF